MSDVVTAARAAEAALQVAAGGAPIAIALLVVPDEPVQRLIIHASGEVEGRLRGAAEEAARRIAATLLPAGSAATAEPVVETVVLDDVACTLYVEAHHAPEHLVIVGAGHIAVPLAHLGVLLDFRVTVLDDREEMATAERFDPAVRVVRADFARDPFAGVELGPNSYVALVTRGHKWDFDCLQRVLRQEERPKYIGMIGSRRRVRAAFHALSESGVPREVLATIRAPIGLEIEAETPAEIAVAIAAEVVGVRRGVELVGRTA